METLPPRGQLIKTDQQSLRYMMIQHLTEDIQHKLLLKLLEFDYKIEYKKGRDNKVADTLSRRGQAVLAISAAILD
jgi:hypothetical protein